MQQAGNEVATRLETGGPSPQRRPQRTSHAGQQRASQSRQPIASRAPSSLQAALRVLSPASTPRMAEDAAPQWLSSSSAGTPSPAQTRFAGVFGTAAKKGADAVAAAAPATVKQPIKGPPIRTLELLRAKFIQILGIDALKQTFEADVFFEFKIRGGAHDKDLTAEGDGPPSTYFPSDTLRPSARWYLNQIEFSNSVIHSLHSDTCVVIGGTAITITYRIRIALRPGNLNRSIT